MMAAGQYGGHGGPVSSHNNYSNGMPQSTNQTRPLDLRVILSRDEVAFLFGFDGMLINQLRQQTGANIQITEGDSFEYVLLVSGSIELIFKAFSLVCRKLWDLLTNIAGPGHNRPLKIRVAVPAVQCGSIIGKAGAKVKEIRDLTGAQIQVSHDPLPNSTERCVEISGSGESCLQCTYQICIVMQESPLRGEVIPYVPPVNNSQPRHQEMAANMDAWRPVFLCGDKAFIIEGQFAKPAPPELLRRELSKNGSGGAADDPLNPLALVAAISKAQSSGQPQPHTSREMTVNSEMINAMMVSSQGQKIEEVQRMSGAQVHVSDQVQVNGDCIITLSGSEESILLAQFLIQSNIDLIMKEKQHPPPPDHGLIPTNQFDPSIMQQNYESGGNYQQQQQGQFNNRNNFRNNSGDRFQQRPRGGRRSPQGDRRGGGGPRRGRR